MQGAEDVVDMRWLEPLLTWTSNDKGGGKDDRATI
jgi:hypothetical protein